MDLRFRQTYINSAERLLITKRVAFLLSLLPEKVEEKKYNFEVSLAPGLARLRRRRRELQTEVVASELDELTSKMTVTVLADPKSAVYPAPIVRPKPTPITKSAPKTQNKRLKTNNYLFKTIPSLPKIQFFSKI